MYRIYKINVPYSCRDYLGRDYAPDFMDVLKAQAVLYPEKIAEFDDSKRISKEWKKAKKKYKYIEKCKNWRGWSGVYIELCSDEEDSISEPSYGDENFYVKDIQIPIYKKSDIKWLR